MTRSRCAMSPFSRFLTMAFSGCAVTAFCRCAVATFCSSFVLGALLQHRVSVDRGLCEKPAEPQGEANGCDDNHDQGGHRQDQGDEL